MGNNICMEDVGQIEKDSILQIPKDPIVKVYSSDFNIDFEESKVEMAKSSISTIKIKKDKPIKINCLVSNNIEKIVIPLKNMKKKCSDFQQEDSKFSIYCVQFGQYQKKDKQGPIVQFAVVNVKQTNQTSIIAFIGEYKANKKSKGIYLLIKEKEAFMFQGVFESKERIGIKVSLGSKRYEKYLGKFDSKFELIGQGKSISYAENDDENTAGEYYYFQGQFASGSREGKGILKIQEENSSFKPRLDINEKHLQSSLIEDCQLLLRNGRGSGYGKLMEKLLQLINPFSAYTPNMPQLQEIDCKLVVEGTWKKNSIQGLTEERWPQKKYRFYGVYKENERNGYGEEYSYNQKIAKGFYKKGTMESDKDNEFLLLGFKLLNGQWKRNNE